MKTATKIMYFIGRIFNWVELFAGLILIIIGSVILGISLANGGGIGENAAALSLLTPGIILFVVALIVITLAKKASKSLNKPGHKAGPHVFMLVIGIISENIFYVLGGIFGLIAR